MKSIDDVKKGLVCCTGYEYCPGECPYHQNTWCESLLLQDSLTLIRQLQYALLLMVSQYCTEDDGSVFHRFMTAGEHAFVVLGIAEPSIHESELEAMIDSLEKEMYP